MSGTVIVKGITGPIQESMRGHFPGGARARTVLCKQRLTQPIAAAAFCGCGDAMVWFCTMSISACAPVSVPFFILRHQSISLAGASMLVDLRLLLSASHISGTRQAPSLQGLLESQGTQLSGHYTSLGICLQSSRVATESAGLYCARRKFHKWLWQLALYASLNLSPCVHAFTTLHAIGLSQDSHALHTGRVCVIALDMCGEARMGFRPAFAVRVINNAAMQQPQVTSSLLHETAPRIRSWDTIR